MGPRPCCTIFGVPTTPTPLLDVSELTVRVPSEKGAVTVFAGLSLQVRAGEICDISGPSGSGKSMLLRAIARLVPDSAGSLALEGVPAEKIGPEVWRSRVALLPQKPALVRGTVEENMLLPWRFKVRAGTHCPADRDMRAALDALGLCEISLDRDASRLSVGQQARLAFARTWLTSAEVLLLDEAEAALDPASVADLASAVCHFAEKGATGSPSGAPGAVIRVRHAAGDGLAARRLRLESGRLEEVAG